MNRKLLSALCPPLSLRLRGKKNPLGTAHRAGLRRRAVRCFVLVVAAVMFVHSAPASWHWLAKPKQVLSVVLNRVGLWQGTWGMFTPNPVLNNGWFTAEIQHADGTQSQWNSPYWSQSDSSDKFLRFRYLNHFNRLPDLSYHAAREDLADYLARQSSVPVDSIKLYHTRMRLILPDDGTLPKRDEVSWMFSSELVAKRTYSQSGRQQGSFQSPSSPQSSSPQSSSPQSSSPQSSSPQSSSEP